ncbi:phospho-sugar mutase [Acidaminobacter sp. JC074]|uniref:phospho-sugar mutase n=1 Tax=Acidaminobacter sp. JC074 TaxID=2530199 RepID=UPI001F0EEAAD|nr:phospho-sugar mutase [Acidaminobacter sp. JC074]MCH4889319.1 phospho-sugar mutase [Acidaminobacter sp. JC074]
MDYKKKYNEWLNNDYFSDEFRQELKSIENDEKEIEERFYKDMEFGTGGMRGTIGAGTNRMNEYVIRKASQGFCNFALNRYKENSIVIAHDCRHKSPEFALETALVFAANGVKAYLFESLRSTPELSYAVRHLNASVGVVVTASHNPPAYNGYKVYGDDGCQLLPVDADKVVEEVNKIQSFDEVKYMTKEEAIEKGLLVYLDEQQDNDYLDMVESAAIDPNVIAEVEDLKIVYSALHGTGARPIELIMKRRGLKHFYPVKEQMVADSNFSTLKSPNPEDVSAFEYGIELAKEKDADVVIATDPDCDRVGVVVKHEGDYVALNGNQTGVLLVDYVLGNTKDMPEKPFLVNTIVTSGMAEKIIKSYGAELMSTLTGFKFIGEQIKLHEDGSKQFLFGYEESYGYLAGTHVRDKDAVIATMLVVEMVATYKKQGKTLMDVLDGLYKKVGYYQESLTSIVLEGKAGLEKIARVMSSLRENPIQSVAGLEMDKVMDCLDQTITSKEGKVDNGLPKSNVLKYYLEDGSWFAARPSGTEPKLKVYFSVVGDTREHCLEKLAKVEKEVLEIVKSID